MGPHLFSLVLLFIYLEYQHHIVLCFIDSAILGIPRLNPRVEVTFQLFNHHSAVTGVMATTITMITLTYMSLCVRKPTICMGENKDADQLRGNREADQRLCFRYTDSTFPPLLISKFSRSWVSCVTAQPGLCWTWSETQIVGFLMHRLNYLNPANADSPFVP